MELQNRLSPAEEITLQEMAKNHPEWPARVYASILLRTSEEQNAREDLETNAVVDQIWRCYHRRGIVGLLKHIWARTNVSHLRIY